MLITLLDKIYMYRLQKDKQSAINILMAEISDLQVQALEDLAAEVDDAIDQIVPGEEDIAKLHPEICRNCD